jgi:Protein of unknown function (DUF3768)
MSNRIAELNDALRTTLSGGRVYLTPGIAALSPSAQESIVARVRAFDDFTPDNDPYGEHDFGILKLNGATIYWKICTTMISSSVRRIQKTRA